MSEGGGDQRGLQRGIVTCKLAIDLAERCEMSGHGVAISARDGAGERSGNADRCHVREFGVTVCNPLGFLPRSIRFRRGHAHHGHADLRHARWAVVERGLLRPDDR